MKEEDYKIAYENVMIANKMLEKETEKLKEENKQLKKCNRESITFLNQDDIRDMLLQKDYKIFCLQQRIDKAIKHIETHQLCYQSQYEEMSGFDNHLLDILKGDKK